MADKYNPRSRWRDRILRLAIGMVAIPVLLYLLFLAAVAFWPYPDGLDRPPPAGTWLEDRDGVPLAAFVADDGQWHLPLSQDDISPHLLKAIVAVEDGHFYEHAGVNWKSIAAACWQDLKCLRIVRGGSTLTMQLHRLRDPQPRGLFNKFTQAVRAKQIEKKLTKDQILVEYINRAPFGGNLVGAGAASWRYFGKPCRELSLGQAALLAGLPQRPRSFRPDRYPQRAIARRDYVLDRMLACGMITQTQRDEAAHEPLDAAWHPLPQMCGGANLPSADGALPTLSWLASHHPRQTLRTTLDEAVQHQAALAARQHLDQLAPSGVNAVAVVVVDAPTGECLAAVSLTRDTAGSLDLTRSPRSTGSALKPFIYAAAFEAGICSPGTILHDTPAAWPGYEPANYDHGYRGAIPAGDALAESRNIPALVVLSQVGVERACGFMGTMGLRTLARRPQRYGLSLAIGGAEATPMEMAEAYAAMARVGSGLPEHSSSSCLPPFLLSSGSSSSSVPPCLRGSLTPDSQVLACLSSPDRTRPICPEAARANVAWKTGTSSGHRDAWCAATTRRRTVVVWLGNPQGQGSTILVGADAAAPLALRLAAALDPTNEPWPAPPLVADNSAPTLSPPRPRNITLVSPADGLEIVYNSDLPADKQKVLLKAQPPAPASALYWFVDGKLIGTADDEGRIWWSPAAGSHDIRVTDAAGHAARAHVRVR